MLANIYATDSNLVTISLEDGRKIIGQLDDSDNMKILENTTNLDDKTAQCAAGLALVIVQVEGYDTMVWRHLLGKAQECKKHVEKIKYQLN